MSLHVPRPRTVLLRLQRALPMNDQVVTDSKDATFCSEDGEEFVDAIETMVIMAGGVDGDSRGDTEDDTSRTTETSSDPLPQQGDDTKNDDNDLENPIGASSSKRCCGGGGGAEVGVAPQSPPSSPTKDQQQRRIRIQTPSLRSLSSVGSEPPQRPRLIERPLRRYSSQMSNNYNIYHTSSAPFNATTTSATSSPRRAFNRRPSQIALAYQHEHTIQAMEPPNDLLTSVECNSLRLILLNVTGLLLIVGGIVWAVWHYQSAPVYLQQIAVPTNVFVCSEMEALQQQVLVVEDTQRQPPQQHQQSQAAEVAAAATACKDLQAWQKPCTFAVFYNFSTTTTDDDLIMELDDETTTTTNINSTSSLRSPTNVDDDELSGVEVVYSGLDILLFVKGSNQDYSQTCHEIAPIKRQELLQNVQAVANTTTSTNATTTNTNTTNSSKMELQIYYNSQDPTDNHITEPPTAATTAGIIAGIACALGMLFWCLSCVEWFC